MAKSLKLFPILTVFFISSFGQTNPQETPPHKLVDPNETVLRYEEFLREETKLHREYTQEYYDMLWKLLGAIGILVGGVLTWLNWKSKSDIKKEVNEQFKETVQGLLDEKLRQIDNLIKEGKEKSTKQFDDIGRIILELSAKSEKISDQGQEEIEKEEKSDVERLKGKSILWVDDHPENNTYLMEMLARVGVKFTLGFDTDQAMKLVKMEKFDLIISDIGRGNNRTAGLDLLKELKKLNNRTPIIIFASASAIGSYGKEALELGAIEATAGTTKVLSTIQRILKLE